MDELAVSTRPSLTSKLPLLGREAGLPGVEIIAGDVERSAAEGELLRGGKPGGAAAPGGRSAGDEDLARVVSERPGREVGIAGEFERAAVEGQGAAGSDCQAAHGGGAADGHLAVGRKCRR